MFAQASPPQDWVQLIIQYGFASAFGYMLVIQVPWLQTKFIEALASQRREFIEDMTKQREDFQLMLDREREAGASMVKMMGEAHNRELERVMGELGEIVTRIKADK